jgi:acetylglutamate kinase
MIMHRPDPAVAIRSLRSAAPYIRMYKGKTFVVKAGGGVFADAAAVRGLIEQIAILHYFGVRVVFVHGGGPQLTEITEALGVPTRMVQGRRVTDQKAIDATSMVLNGLINTKLLASAAR